MERDDLSGRNELWYSGIGSTVGGPVEIVEHGLNGYRIDVHDLDKIEETIRFLSSNRGECLVFVDAAWKKGKHFSIVLCMQDWRGDFKPNRKLFYNKDKDIPFKIDLWITCN